MSKYVLPEEPPNGSILTATIDFNNNMMYEPARNLTGSHRVLIHKWRDLYWAVGVNRGYNWPELMCLSTDLVLTSMFISHPEPVEIAPDEK